MNEANLICLNNRDHKYANCPQFTYHQRGKEAAKSIIDVICVSRDMFPQEYKTTVLPVTLTGSKSHYPIFADTRLSRNKFRSRKPTPKKWNLSILSSPKKLLDFTTLRDHNISGFSLYLAGLLSF
jgi:hypothetical protein